MGLSSVVRLPTSRAPTGNPIPQITPISTGQTDQCRNQANLFADDPMPGNIVKLEDGDKLTTRQGDKVTGCQGDRVTG